MAKKLLMAWMALAVFAVLTSPVASASPLLTENESTVAPGQKITATQLGTSKLTNTGGKSVELECSKGTLTGELTKNDGAEIEGEITSAIFSGTGGSKVGEPAETTECTGEAAFGNASITAVVSKANPWCLKSIAEDKFTLRGGSCGGLTSNIKFIMVTTLAGSCEYESTNHLIGIYTTNGTSAVLKLANVAHSSGSTENGFKRIAGSAFCPSSGSLDMEFTLETDSAEVKPLVIS